MQRKEPIVVKQQQEGKEQIAEKGAIADKETETGKEQ